MSPMSNFQQILACLLFLYVAPTHGFQLSRLPNTKSIRAEGNVHPRPRPWRLVTASSELSLANNNDIDDGGAVTKTIGPKTKTEIRNIASHVSKQTLESLLTADETKTIANELLFDSKSTSTIFNDSSYEQYVKYWKKVELRLREESDRTPADILGEELTNRILSSIGGDGNGVGSYDAQTVLAFLESDAVNSLFTQLLYDAIFEFTLKVDIIGNAISNLPLLGPVRNQVLKESKRNMDRTLGPLLQKFLSGYTRVAIRQAAAFVVSEENASAFGKANARLVGYLLEKRTVAEWIPEEKILAGWRDEAWAYLARSEENGGGGNAKDDQKKVIMKVIEWTYDVLGDKCVEDAGVNVNAILDASPTLERSLGSFWEQCRDAARESSKA